MKTKHTPGPWSIPTGATRKVHGRNDEFIASTETEDVLVSEAEANAKLIASAPEMLEMLAKAWHIVADHDGNIELANAMKGMVDRLTK